jgi:uncharacterized membrane protein
MSNICINIVCLSAGCVFLCRQSRALMPYSLALALIAFLALFGENISNWYDFIKILVGVLRLSVLIVLLLMIVYELGKVTSKHSSLTHQLPMKYLAQWVVAGLIVSVLTFGMAMMLKGDGWKESRTGISGSWFVGASTALTLGVFWMACIGLIVPYFLGKLTMRN